MSSTFNTDTIQVPTQHLTMHGPTDIDIRYTLQIKAILTKLLTESLRPSYLPEKPLYFFGREQECTEIVQALLNFESVIIPGGGGMGKTTLALAVLHDQRIIFSKDFQSRIYFIDCSTITILEGLYCQLAVDLQIPKDQRNSHLQETLLAMFRNMPSTILCLDNFETLWDVSEARSNIQTMLSRFHAISTLALLLTMRGTHRPANVYWSKASPRTLSRLPLDASTDIFRKESHFHDIDEYAQMLINAADGMPLTIALLARQAQIETPKAIWARWTTNGTSVANQGSDRTMNLGTSIELLLSSPRLKGNVSAIQTLGILAHLLDGLEYPSDIAHDLQSSLSDDVNVADALGKLVTAGLAHIDTIKSDCYQILSPISKYTREHKLMGASVQCSVIDYYITFILDRTMGFAVAQRNSSLHATVPKELANIHSILEFSITEHISLKKVDQRQINALLAHTEWQ